MASQSSQPCSLFSGLLANGGALRLESVHAVSGEITPLAIDPATARARALPKSSPSAQWSRKAFRWAVGGTIAAGVGLFAAFPAQAQNTLSPSPALPLAQCPAQAQAVAQAACAQWNWAREHGFFQSAQAPAIRVAPAAQAMGSEGPASASPTLHYENFGAQITPSAVIEISETAKSVGFSSAIPLDDIQAIMLHEGYHAESFLNPQANRFAGALAQGDLGQMWQAAVWAQSATTNIHGARAVYGQDVFSMEHLAPDVSTIFKEAGADSFAFIVLAHQLSQDDWTARLLKAEGYRALNMLAADPSADPHETQESLQILASIGHEKLAALTPEQSLRLADAVAADGVFLAAGKQGWIRELGTAALLAPSVARWSEKSLSPIDAWELHNLLSGLKPAAVAWAARSQSQREAVVAQWKAAAQAWTQGAALDYGFVAPGLRGRVLPHAEAVSYESQARLDAATGLDTPRAKLTDSQVDAILARQSRGALKEWRETAMLAGESDGSKITGTREFNALSKLVDTAGLSAMRQDAFWAAGETTLATRLNERRRATVAQLAQAEAQQQTLSQAPAAPSP